MTEQEDYDRRRKAKYARERKATEEALRPRMVKPGPSRVPAKYCYEYVSAFDAVIPK